MFGANLSIPAVALARGKSPAWYRRTAELLDGVSPGFYLDVYNQRHALAGGAATLADLLSVANNSAARTYVDKTGAIATAAPNTPRIDWTSGSPELLLEGPATNPIRNSIGAGAVVGTPGTMPTYWSKAVGAGLSSQIVGTGVDAGLQYVRFRVWGTTTAPTQSLTMAFDGYSVAPAAPGETWTASVFMRLVGGGFAPNYPALVVTEYGSTGTYLVNSGAVPTLSAAWKRVPATRTLSNASAAYVATNIYAQWPLSGTAVDVTFDVALPQIEKSSTASSPIVTNGAAVTRTADLCALAPAAAAVLAGAGAVALRGTIPSGTVYQGQIIGQASANGLLRTNTAGTGLVIDGRVDDLGALVWFGALPGAFGLAAGWGASGRIGSLGGAAALTDAGLMDIARSPLYLGGPSGLVAGQAIRVRQLVGWTLPDRPSAAGIQAQARLAA